MGAEHSEVFAKDVGTWDAEVEVRPPGIDVQRSKGVMTARRLGNWLVTDFKNESGFEGHGVYGWDASRKRYVGVWVDSMRTTLAPMEGEWDAANKRMTMRGQMKLADGNVMAWREITETVDPDTQTFRSILLGPNGEHEMMKVTYRRRA
jgi:Protein of unknown function (DUF1579)